MVFRGWDGGSDWDMGGAVGPMAGVGVVESSGLPDRDMAFAGLSMTGVGRHACPGATGMAPGRRPIVPSFENYFGMSTSLFLQTYVQ